LTGLAAVTGYAATNGGASAHIGDLLLAAGVLSCAVGYVEGARVARRIGATPALCWAMLLLAPAAVPLLAAAALTRHVAPIPASAWAGLGYTGVISMFAASLVWYRALAVGGTARIGQLNLAQPFLAIAWSALLLGEHITWAVPVTAAIVLCCMVVCLHNPPGQAAAPAASKDPARRPGTPSPRRP
jgi:drug/metabolite transporter (DMT)-like permease